MCIRVAAAIGAQEVRLNAKNLRILELSEMGLRDHLAQPQMGKQKTREVE